MRTIQEVGNEILSKNPKQFYVFTGPEYGVKTKYIDMLADYYGCCSEVPSVQSIVSYFSKRQIIPPKPTLYIVRYDEEFLSSLDERYAEKLKRCKIVGTVVCIYEDFNKGVSKLEKFIPDYTVNIGCVSPAFVSKYLHSDFPKLPDRFIDIAVKYSKNYGDARNMCSSMSLADVESLYEYNDQQIAGMFGKFSDSSDQNIRIGIASRNFKFLMDTLDDYPDNLDNVIYTVLATLVDYIKRWTLEDVYNMFMNSYAELVKLRSYSTDYYSSLTYLLSLLKFSKIPSVEDMQ